MVDKGIGYLEGLRDSDFNGGHALANLSGEAVLVAYAHYMCRHDATNPVVKRGLKHANLIATSFERGLGENAQKRNYLASVSVLLLAEVDPQRYKKDLSALHHALLDGQSPNGAICYPLEQPTKAGDVSQTQWVVLALWTLEQCGHPTDRESVLRTHQWILRVQDPSGGWPYHGRDPGVGESNTTQGKLTMSMGLAGCNTVLISTDLLGLEDKALRRNTNSVRQSIQFFENWRKKNPYKRTTSIDWYYYQIWSLERFHGFRESLYPRNSGHPADWYDSIVAELASTQGMDGGWGGRADRSHTRVPTSTAFALLFLVRSTEQTIELQKESVARDSESPARAPIPTGAEQAIAMNTVKSIFESDYRKAASPTERITLARAVFAMAKSTNDDSPGRYALLNVAREIACSNGDVELANEIVDVYAKHYEIDDLVLETQVYLALKKTVHDPRDARSLYGLMQNHVAALDNQASYDKSLKIAMEAVEVAMATEDLELIGSAKTMAQRARTRIKQFADVIAAQQASAEGRQDPLASQTLGEHYCYTKANWREGIPLLAIGEPRKSRDLAVAELQSDGSDAVEIGNGWWELAGTQQGDRQLQIRLHAVSLYKRGAEGLSGLRLKLIEKRISDTPGSDSIAAWQPYSEAGLNKGLERTRDAESRNTGDTNLLFRPATIDWNRDMPTHESGYVRSLYVQRDILRDLHFDVRPEALRLDLDERCEGESVPAQIFARVTEIT